MVTAASWLPAHELAGQETSLNMTAALSLTLSVSLAGTGLWMWGRHHKRRADELEERNADLSEKVKRLESEDPTKPSGRGELDGVESSKPSNKASHAKDKRKTEPVL
ncbi:hypothetical protein E0H73_42885 [Kribbella pittospori]|uniref:Uncharacterized protein n=1 Tax=Kribbella pittospori TaxID=722689 RepID=A0A4R0JP64_9ACTN|nr:hypothetical protein [Kribbella pittospori]TCC48549.1 hypothetical protein E0H73_42885 [Kribbella pittospori]